MAWLRTFSSRSSTRQSSRINTQHSLPTERLCLNITNQWAQTHLNRLQWECVGKQLIKQKWQRQSPSRQRDSVKAWDVIYLAQSNSRNVPSLSKTNSSLSLTLQGKGALTSGQTELALGQESGRVHFRQTRPWRGTVLPQKASATVCGLIRSLHQQH